MYLLHIKYYSKTLQASFGLNFKVKDLHLLSGPPKKTWHSLSFELCLAISVTFFKFSVKKQFS